MNAKVFIATPSKGISRAEFVHGEWKVESLLTGEVARCLAVDSQNQNIVYVGTR